MINIGGNQLGFDTLENPGHIYRSKLRVVIHKVVKCSHSFT